MKIYSCPSCGRQRWSRDPDGPCKRCQRKLKGPSVRPAMRVKNYGREVALKQPVVQKPQKKSKDKGGRGRGKDRGNTE